MPAGAAQPDASWCCSAYQGATIRTLLLVLKFTGPTGVKIDHLVVSSVGTSIEASPPTLPRSFLFQ